MAERPLHFVRGGLGSQPCDFKASPAGFREMLGDKRGKMKVGFTKMVSGYISVSL